MDILGKDFACIEARYSAILCGGWAAMSEEEEGDEGWSFAVPDSSASLRFY